MHWRCIYNGNPYTWKDGLDIETVKSVLIALQCIDWWDWADCFVAEWYHRLNGLLCNALSDECTDCFAKHWLVIMAWRPFNPSHYQNQNDLVKWTFRNNTQWNFNQKLTIFIHENAFINVYKMAAILSQPQCVTWITTLTLLLLRFKQWKIFAQSHNK